MDGGQASALRDEYVDPVGRLLRLGEPDSDLPAEWTDYSATFGFGEEHVATLIEMACDAALHACDLDSQPSWAPVHAWRALGQLRAHAAVQPLLTLLQTLEDEAAIQDMPVVFGMIGPAAIPALATAVLDLSSPVMRGSLALDGLKEIVARYPECRDECIGIAARVLDPHATPDPIVASFAVGCLIDLHAVEAIDAIAAAFERNALDMSICGDLEEVEIELGLRTHRATPKPRFSVIPGDWSVGSRAHQISRDVDVLPPLAKIGRNEPCPCGSGKKYKKCCLP